MSRIGKKAVDIPDGVNVNVDGQQISVKGPKGELAHTFVDDVVVAMANGGVELKPRDDSGRARAMWGMSRTVVNNLIEGVVKGFEKELEINGVGYRAQMQGKNLQLQLGFSHDIVYDIPEGIDVKCAKPTEILVSGIDKQKVGQVAAEIRSYRPPEPYKGKGVRYKGEYVMSKEGKKK